MKIGPKYKIARRLGAPVFEKTQSQKYAISESKKQRGPRKRRGQVTDYGLQMLEKQKARYSYVLSEKQFSRNVKEAIGQRQQNPAESLYQKLESRLDNVVTRAQFGPSRLFARQAVSHGHIYVNGRKVTIPSYRVKEGDVVSVKPSSVEKGLFIGLDERLNTATAPAWLSVDTGKKEITVVGVPRLEDADLLFDINTVLEFYSR